MSDKLVDLLDLRFILYDVLDVEKLTSRPYHEDHSRETFDMALDTAYELSQELFWPSYQECDATGVHFDGEKTTVPEPLHAIWKACKEGGWFAPSASYEAGGQQFPVIIQAVTSLMFNAGNTSASMYIGLTSGAALLVDSFGTDALKSRYLQKLNEGEWAGTMALTEPQAGTSLSDIKTTAEKVPGGDYYLIRGTKRFISSGDHDLAPNIIHPTLARIEGAPPGAKGISLFLVPKFRLNEDGTAGESNDLATGGIEHKLGLKAQGTATLNYGDHGDCRGWLLGEANEGLSCMFELMNTARIFVGIQAIGQACCAYHCAVQYCREREQGREILNDDPAIAQVPIIRHPAIRRKLLIQKTQIEGVTSLLLYCAFCADEMRTAEDDAEREKYRQILELLTPVCKAHGSDVSYECIYLAMQCYGGSGYIEDFPLAQMLRDNRVFSIYEGTNDVQAMDLLGRKVAAANGAYLMRLLGEIGQTIAEAAGLEGLEASKEKVSAALGRVAEVSQHLGKVGLGGDVNLYISHATPYLKILSQLVVAWRFLAQSVVAERSLTEGNGPQEESFYRAKLATAGYYINTILPTNEPLIECIMADERAPLDYDEAWF